MKTELLHCERCELTWAGSPGAPCPRCAPGADLSQGMMGEPGTLPTAEETKQLKQPHRTRGARTRTKQRANGGSHVNQPVRGIKPMGAASIR